MSGYVIGTRSKVGFHHGGAETLRKHKGFVTLCILRASEPLWLSVFLSNIMVRLNRRRLICRVRYSGRKFSPGDTMSTEFSQRDIKWNPLCKLRALGASVVNLILFLRVNHHRFIRYATTSASSWSLIVNDDASGMRLFSALSLDLISDAAIVRIFPATSLISTAFSLSPTKKPK
jgi:hypothetical protein